jgi:hypothetical protein
MACLTNGGFMKKIIALLLVVVMSCGMLVACGNNEDDGTTTLLSFAQTMSVDNIKDLDGKKVQMMGYMSTLSPINGQFMYLMNLPYQSCPFCIPNTTTLSNTIAVYAKNGDEFSFTPEAIMIRGTLEVGSWTDEFGYNYDYRIKDATFEVVKADELSEELKTWQALAASGVIADVYNMFDYVYFTCFWAEYTAEFGGGADYIYPDDVPNFLNGQFAECMKEDYFDKLIAKVEEVDKTAFKDLIDSINAAKELRDMGMTELEEKDYTKVTEYSNVFHDGRDQYKLNEVDKLMTVWQATYGKFSEWLANWEL